MKRVLVVQTGGGVGDVLLSTPVLQALKHAEPQAELHYLCRESTAGVLEGNPDLSRLWRLPGSAPSGGREFLGWVGRLRRERYDAAVVLWSVSRIAWLLWLARIPIRVGEGSRLGYSFTYTHRVRLRTRHGDTTSHWTDVLLDYVRALGIEPPPPRVTYVVPEEARRRAEELLREAPGEGPLVGFHTGKGMELAPGRWPVSVFAEWARALSQELGVRLVLTGSTAERSLVDEVERLSGVAALNLAGRTDLPTLAAVAERCQVFCCPDSGPMHVAAAVGTPAVGIYALEEDFPHRWAPFGVPSRVIRPVERNCRPGCLKATCPDFRCYRSVETAAVVRAVRELLASHPQAHPPRAGSRES
ncbi:MAG: glycosyltransferase family 9 protein [Armatimonadetes bacterium]|nr:glycosyltransferase family 9 protein [Armatimonadota bacterium]